MDLKHSIFRSLPNFSYLTLSGKHGASIVVVSISIYYSLQVNYISTLGSEIVCEEPETDWAYGCLVEYHRRTAAKYCLLILVWSIHQSNFILFYIISFIANGINIIIQLGGGGLILCKVTITPVWSWMNLPWGRVFMLIPWILLPCCLIPQNLKASAGDIMLHHAVVKWQKADQALQVMNTQWPFWSLALLLTYDVYVTFFPSWTSNLIMKRGKVCTP